MSPAKQRYIFILIFCGAFLTQTSELAAAEPTIHFVMCADTNDGDLKDGLQSSVGIMSYLFYLNVPKRQLQFHEVVGDGVNINSIIRKVRSLPVGPNDTLIFQFSGHGAYEKNRREHLMTFTNDEILTRSAIRKELQAKNARLVVLLTDTCSNFVEIYGNSPAANPPQVITPLFDQLFLKNRGLVDISATMPGEYGICFAKGTTFVLSFSSVLSNSNRRLTWEQVIFELNKNTKEIDHALVDQTAYAVLPLPGAAPRNTNPVPRTKYWLGAFAKANPGGGVEVTRIVANSPASRIRDSNNNSFRLVGGRDVVTHVNGQAVNSNDEFIAAIRRSGKTARLQVYDKQTRQSGGYYADLVPAQ